MTPESDAAVISASLVAPARFGELFDRHATTLFRYIVRRVGVEAAEPMLGDVFRIAFEKRAAYDTQRSNARPWLYGIATNLIQHHRRGEARRIHATARLLAQTPSGDDATERVDTRIDAADLWPRVARALEALPDNERDTLLLYAWEELGYDEIASALCIPIGTVRSRINRARRSLRELQASIGRQE
jgi:RNA polymerase sigma factor (sigma-70 family)